MTDTGQVPGEGQPGYADAQPQQHPTAAAHGGYAYPDPEAHEAQADVPGDDEDLLMPGAQSAWSDGPSSSGQYEVPYAAQPPEQPAPAQQASPAQQSAPRRPLHLGPPVPEQSGAVRTLADRGPSTPPAARPPAQPSAPEQPSVQPSEPAPEPAPGPEYLDVPHQSTEPPPAPRPGQMPAPDEAWPAAPQGPAVQQDAPPARQPDAAQLPESPTGGPDLAAVPELVASLPAPEQAQEQTVEPAPEQAQEQTVEPQPAPQTVPAAPDAEAGAAAPIDASRPEPLPPQQAEAAEQESGLEAVPPPADHAASSSPDEKPAPPPESAEHTHVPAGVTEDVRPGHETAASGPQEPGDASPGPVTDPAGPDGAPEPQAAPATADPVPDAATTGSPASQGHDTPAPPDVVRPGVPAPRQGTEPEPESEAGPGAGHPVAGDTPAGHAPGTDETGTPGSPGAVAASQPADEAAPRTERPDGQQAASTAGEAEPVSHEPAAPVDAGLPQPADGAALQSDLREPGEAAGPGETAGPGATAGPGDAVEAAPDAAVPEQTAPPISEDGPAEDAAPSDGGVSAAEDLPAGEPGEEPVAVDAPGAAAVTGGPAAPGYSEADREAVHRLMRERRDIRNGFRPDPIPHEVLLRVLEAAHTAPSVGHSQPWDFVVIRSEDTRRTMHELARRQREVYAKSLPKARAKQFKQLKIEAILDTPVNIVVTADPTRGGRHTLGRHTQPQMAPYSSALAVENLWLAARAEGLGVGWVSFFDEREMVRALDLPDHLEVVAYLCIGYVDEFPPEPELMQAGWSKRRPLSWVVHEESYGRRALPGAEPHDLLAETLERIRPLDAKALGEAWERQKRMTKPAGALGMLEIISAQLCGLSRQCPPPVPEPAAVAVFAGDHGVHAQGVTPWPQEVTAQMVANFLGGGAVCNAFANQVGAEVCVIDVGVSGELPATPGLLPRKVRPGTADMTQGPALTQEEVLRAIEVGIETARDLVAAGNKALVTGEMGIANTTASAALIAACTGADATEVTGRGTGIDDETHARKVEVVRRALQLHQPDPADPVGMLTALGGLEHAALTGFLLGGASLRTPVILDGVSAGAAALVARQIAPEALAACIAGHRSAEPGHVAALTKLGLRPLIDLDLRLGEGTGALLALPMVQSAARAMHEVATFDSAGVTEKN